MSPEDREKLIKKIRKCLALANSSNPHEAAAAMRQAQAMMAAADVTEDDLLAAEASAAEAKSTCSRDPAIWEGTLARVVSRAFGVDVIFTPGQQRLTRALRWQRGHGVWVFIGTGAAPDVATYSMSVLLRLVAKARAQYRGTLGRRKASSKARACDLFCDGWVWQVRQHVEEFAAPLRNERAITAYTLKHFPDLVTADLRDRNSGKLSDRQLGSLADGMLAAKDVRLQHGMTAGAAAPGIGQTLAIEHK